MRTEIPVPATARTLLVSWLATLLAVVLSLAAFATPSHAGSTSKIGFQPKGHVNCSVLINPPTLVYPVGKIYARTKVRISCSRPGEIFARAVLYADGKEILETDGFRYGSSGTWFLEKEVAGTGCRSYWGYLIGAYMQTAGVLHWSESEKSGTKVTLCA